MCVLQCVLQCVCVLQSVTVCCCELQSVAKWCSVFVAVCRGVCACVFLSSPTRNESSLIPMCDSLMGWLRSVGSINYTSLLQNIVSFIGLFCKRDLKFW